MVDIILSSAYTFYVNVAVSCPLASSPGLTATCLHVLQVRPEEQHYLNKLLFSFESLPHHVLHLSHPLLFHNLLPYKVTITTPCNETILSGQQVYISKYDPSDSLDIAVKVCAAVPVWCVQYVLIAVFMSRYHVQVYQGDTVFSGEVHVANKMEESSTFKFASSSSKHEMVSKIDC